MKKKFTCEEIYLLGLLRIALEEAPSGTPDVRSSHVCQEKNQPDYQKLLTLAKSHAVLPLLYDVLEPDEKLPQREREILTRLSRQTVQQSYHLLFLTKYLVELLNENQIPSVVLKGAGTAAFYPVPELRKSGDIDLLLSGEADTAAACGLLKACGFTVKGTQTANHHVVCVSSEGIGVELHTMLAEPFDHERTNAYLIQMLPECFQNIEYPEVMGVKIPVLKDSYHAFSLLLHMLQHFLRAGFGLKLLCDWVVFWNRDLPEDEKQTFLHLVRKSQISAFAEIITAVCVRYLGLKQSHVSFLIRQAVEENPLVDEFMRETLEAEEFGKSGPDRMVVLRGTKLPDYFREFHHQMRLTYPKAGRICLFWPVLWVRTLIGFLYNNYRIRKIPGIAIIKKAGKRSRLMEQIGLFNEK